MIKFSAIAAAVALSVAAMGANADITGWAGAKINSNDIGTIEAGIDFDNALKLYVELDGLDYGDGDVSNSTTLGVETGADHISQNLTYALGYSALITNVDGGHGVEDESLITHRPYVKLGYNFNNGFTYNHRTRVEFGDTADDIRMDNSVAYEMYSMPFALSYNNVYTFEADQFDHEFRVTYTDFAVKPFVEYQHNADAFVAGFMYNFGN